MRFRITFDWVFPPESNISEEGHRRAANLLKDKLERSLEKELLWFDDYRIENLELRVMRRNTRAARHKR